MAHLKVGWCVSMTARLTAGHCVWLYSVSNLLPNKRAQSSLRHVPGSHFWSTIRLPTSGHVKQRQRQRRRLHDSHCGVMCCQVWRKNLRTLVSSNAKPTAWPGLILSGFVWPDPVCGLSDTWPVQLLAGGLILYVACQVMACLVPGLCACHGLIRFCTRSVWLRLGLA